MKIIDFNKAKKKIVLKKSPLDEFREKFFGGEIKGKILFLPRRQKRVTCPKCGGFSLVFDFCSVRCRICGWYSPLYGECPHCHGEKVIFENQKMCLHCSATFKSP
jgi:ribosomal protein S27E